MPLNSTLTASTVLYSTVLYPENLELGISSSNFLTLTEKSKKLAGTVAHATVTRIHTRSCQARLAHIKAHTGKDFDTQLFCTWRERLHRSSVAALIAAIVDTVTTVMVLAESRPRSARVQY